MLFVSTGIWVDLGGFDKFTPFKIISPILFLYSLFLINFKKIDKFDSIFFSLIIFILLYAAFGTNEYASLANICLLTLGTFGIYKLYTKIKSKKRRQQILVFLLMILFFQSLLEITFLLSNLQVESFLFATSGRVDGWTTESSHYSFIVLFLCITYVTAFNISLRNARFILIFFPALFFSQSAYGYLFLVMAAIVIVSNQFGKVRVRHLLPYLLITGIFIFLILLSSYQSASGQRVFDTITGLFNANFQLMDGNARVRIEPFLAYFQLADSFSTINLIFGHGLGSSGFFVREIVGMNTEEGHITSFMYDFGLIGLIWLISLIGYITSRIKNKLWIRLVIAFMLFNMNLGTQVFWFSIFCISVMRFEQKKSNESLRYRGA